MHSKMHGMCGTIVKQNARPDSLWKPVRKGVRAGRTKDQPGLFINTGLNTGMTIKPNQTRLFQWFISPEGLKRMVDRGVEHVRGS